MNNLFKTGIAVTFVSGFIFSKILPISPYTFIGKEVEKQMLIQGIFVGATLAYFIYVLWKSMPQRVWLKILLIFGILFAALISGYILTGFVVQPVFISNAWSFRLLGNNESNIVWYWPFGISIATYLLYALVKAFIKIVRGETILF